MLSIIQLWSKTGQPGGREGRGELSGVLVQVSRGPGWEAGEEFVTTSRLGHGAHSPWDFGQELSSLGLISSTCKMGPRSIIVSFSLWSATHPDGMIVISGLIK